MEAARGIQRYLHGKIRERTREAKKKAILRYVKQLSQDLPQLAGKGEPEQLERKLMQLVENKYSQLTLEEAEEEVEKNGNGEEVRDETTDAEEE